MGGGLGGAPGQTALGQLLRPAPRPLLGDGEGANILGDRDPPRILAEVHPYRVLAHSSPNSLVTVAPKISVSFLYQPAAS